MRRVLRVCAAVAAVTLAGCSGGGGQPEESAAEPSPAATPSAPPTAAAPAETPARPDPAAARAAAEMPSENPVPTSEASIRAGRGVYAKICRACHGLQGEGDGPSAPPGTMPANLVDEEWVHGSTDPEIFMNIKYGIEPYEAMEPWGQQLSDEDLWHTVNFLRDLAANAP